MMRKNSYITKKYLDKALDDKFEYYHKDVLQHMTDLKTGFTEQIRGVSDQIKAVDERLLTKIDRIESRLDHVETKVDTMVTDIILIKDVLEEKADRKDHEKLEKRVRRLEQTPRFA